MYDKLFINLQGRTNCISDYETDLKAIDTLYICKMKFSYVDFMKTSQINKKALKIKDIDVF